MYVLIKLSVANYFHHFHANCSMCHSLWACSRKNCQSLLSQCCMSSHTSTGSNQADLYSTIFPLDVFNIRFTLSNRLMCPI